LARITVISGTSIIIVTVNTFMLAS
jgi:hypothetical protein